jgi:hypothetical protein
MNNSNHRQRAKKFGPKWYAAGLVAQAVKPLTFMDVADSRSFTMVLAVANIRLWNSTADLAKFAEQQSIDMKASIAAATASVEAANRAIAIGEWLS